MSTRDYVIGLTVVLANGEMLRLGGKFTKSATGYQLMQLFVGSEGTLGIVTEVILRLVPLPRARVTAVAVFDQLALASQAVSRIMGSGILPATLELMDGTTINVVEDYLHVGLPRHAQALLLLEQDGGDETTARGDVERMADICRTLGAEQVQVAASAAERDKLWQARRSVSAALGRLRPNKLGEDIVVPKSEIPAMIAAVGEIAARYGLPIPVFGHAGDGNLHPEHPVRPARSRRSAARRAGRPRHLPGGHSARRHARAASTASAALKREFLEEAQGPLAVSYGAFDQAGAGPGRPAQSRQSLLRPVAASRVSCRICPRWRASPPARFTNRHPASPSSLVAAVTNEACPAASRAARISSRSGVPSSTKRTASWVGRGSPAATAVATASPSIKASLRRSRWSR